MKPADIGITTTHETGPELKSLSRADIIKKQNQAVDEFNKKQIEENIHARYHYAFPMPQEVRENPELAISDHFSIDGEIPTVNIDEKEIRKHLRVISFNMLYPGYFSGFDPFLNNDKTMSLNRADRVMDVIVNHHKNCDADIIACQELFLTNEQLTRLCERLQRNPLEEKMNWKFIAEEKLHLGMLYNSRVLFKTGHNTAFEKSLIVKFKLNDSQDITVINVHLQHEDNPNLTLRTLKDIIPKFGNTIILGDFNARIYLPIQNYLRGERLNFEEENSCISSLTPWQFSKKLFKSSENKKEYRPVGPSVDSTNGIFFSKEYDIIIDADKTLLQYGKIYIKINTDNLEYTVLTPSLIRVTDKIKKSELSINYLTPSELKKSLSEVIAITSKRGHTQERMFLQAEIKTYHPSISNLSSLERKKLQRFSKLSAFQENEMKRARYLLPLDYRLGILPILLNKTINDVWKDLKTRDKNKNVLLLALAMNFFGQLFVGMEVSEKLHEEMKRALQAKSIYKNYDLQFHFKDTYQGVDSRPHYNIYIDLDFFFELYHLLCGFLEKEQAASFRQKGILDHKNSLDVIGDIDSAIKNHQWVRVESLLMKEEKIGQNFLYECLREIDSPSRLTLLWRHFSPQQQYELLHSTDDRGFGSLHWAIENNKIALLHWLSQQSDLDWNIAANISFHSMNPLHLAVKKRNISAVKILSEQNINILALDSEGNTALDYAWFHRNPVLSTLLRQANYNLFSHLEKSTDLFDRLKSADAKLDSQMMEKTEQSFNSIGRAYETILAHASPKLPGFSWCLMRMSEVHLINQKYVNAMVYATGAYCHHQQFSADNLFISQMQRILVRYLKEQCQLSEIPTIDFLKYVKKLQKHRRLTENVFKSPAFENDTIPFWLKNNTAFFIELIADLFGLSIKILNENPPTKYALLGLGSLSRGEMCPYSDLECALLLEKKDKKILEYFKKLISLFELLVITLGETELYVRLRSGEIFYPLKKGFHLDPNNPLFSGFTGTIENFLNYHIHQNDENYLHSHMLRTVCCITGDEELAIKYEKAKQNLLSSSSGTRWFFSPSKGQEIALNAMKREMHQLLDEKKNTQDISRGFNIKEEWYRLSTQWISHLALYHGSAERNTFDRLEQLCCSEKITYNVSKKLRGLVISIFYLRISAHFYYKCENEYLYLPSYSTLMKDEESAFIINDLEILYQIQKTLLPLEEILNKFVKANGDIDLRYESFQLNLLQQAKGYEQYYAWERAENLYHQLIRNSPENPTAWASFISFYAIKNEILERDRTFLQQQIEYHIKKFLELMIVSGDNLESYYSLITQELDIFRKVLAQFPASVNQVSIEKILLAMQKSTVDFSPVADDLKSGHAMSKIADELKESDQLAQLSYSQERKHEVRLREKSKLCYERLSAYQRHLKNQNNPNQQKKLLRGLIYVLKESDHELFLQKERLKNEVRLRLTQFVKTWQKMHYYLDIYKALPYELQNYFREQLVACQQEKILGKNQDYTLVLRKISSEQKISEIIQKKDFPKRPTLFKQGAQLYIYGLSCQGVWALTKLNATSFKDFKFPKMTKSFSAKKIPREIYDAISEKNGHNPNQTFLRNLLKELNKYLDQKTQQVDWSQYKLRWQMILEACIENKVTTPPCLVSTLLASKDKSSLKSDIYQEIFTEDFRIREHKLYGSQSDIFAIELKPASIDVDEKFTVYFKTRPEMPGMSFLVELIHHFIIHHGTSRCELIRLDMPGNYELCPLLEDQKPKKDKIYVKEKLPDRLEYMVLNSLNQVKRGEIILDDIGYDRAFSLHELKLYLPKILEITTRNEHTSPGDPIPILLSEAVQGENLHDVLEKNPEKLNDLSHKHFSELALIAMLINPGDGKPSNYILVPLPDGKYTLVSVDHDHALFPAYLKETKGDEEITTLQVKTILFCLDAMHQPIDRDARDLFCARRPIEVLRMILQQAQIQNNYYKKLFDSKSTDAFYNKRGIGNCTIPIPIKKGDMVIIYQKMLLLQNYLNNHPDATLLQCLLQVESRVGLTYARALKEIKDPVKRLTTVGNFPVSPTGYMLTASRALMSLRISESILADVDYFALSDLSPEEGLSELDMLAYQQTQLKDVQQEVQEGKFDRFSNLLSPYDQERIICGDFGEKNNRVGLNAIYWPDIHDYEFLSIPEDLKLEINKFYIKRRNFSFIQYVVIDPQGAQREDLIDVKKEFNQLVDFSYLTDLQPFFSKILEIAANRGHIQKWSVRQVQLLDSLRRVSFRKLNLARCHSLNFELAESILSSSPELCYLNLDFNTIFNSSHLIALNTLKVLQILYLRGLPNLTSLNALVLNHLHTLVIERSKNLLNIEITTPALLHLRAKNCPKLKTFKFGSNILQSVDFTNNTDMDVKNFIVEVKQCKNLSILELEHSSLSYFSDYPIMLELECLDSPCLDLIKTVLTKTVLKKALNSLPLEMQLKIKIGLQLIGILEMFFNINSRLIRTDSNLPLNFQKMKILLDFFPQVMATTDLFGLVIDKLKLAKNVSEVTMSVLIKIMQVHHFTSDLISLFYPFFIKHLRCVDISTGLSIFKIIQKQPQLLEESATNLLAILPSLIKDNNFDVRSVGVSLLTGIFKQKPSLFTKLPLLLADLSETKLDNVQSVSARLFQNYLNYSKESFIATPLWEIFCHLITNLKKGTLLKVLEVLFGLCEEDNLLFTSLSIILHPLLHTKHNHSVSIGILAGVISRRPHLTIQLLPKFYHILSDKYEYLSTMIIILIIKIIEKYTEEEDILEILIHLLDNPEWSLRYAGINLFAELIMHNPDLISSCFEKLFPLFRVSKDDILQRVTTLVNEMITVRPSLISPNLIKASIPLLRNSNEDVNAATAKLFFDILTLQPSISSGFVEILTDIARNVSLVDYFVFSNILRKMMLFRDSAIVNEFTAKMVNVIYSVVPFDLRFALKRYISSPADEEKLNLTNFSRLTSASELNQNIDFSEFKVLIDSVKTNVTLTAQIIEVIGFLLKDRNSSLRLSTIMTLSKLVHSEPQSVGSLLAYLESVEQNQRLAAVNAFFSKELKPEKTLVADITPLKSPPVGLPEEKKSSPSRSSYPGEVSKFYETVQSGSIRSDKFLREFVTLLRSEEKSIRSTVPELFKNIIHIQLVKDNLFKLWSEISLLLEKNAPVQKEVLQILLILLMAQPSLINSSVLDKIAKLGFDSIIDAEIQMSAIETICQLGKVWDIHLHTTLSDYIQHQLELLEGFQPTCFQQMATPAKHEAKMIGNGSFFHQVIHKKELEAYFFKSLS